MEVCIGCNARAERHPFLAVCVDPAGRATTHVSCRTCQQNPAHRTNHVKAAYFDRSADDAPHSAAPRVEGASRESQLAASIVAAVAVMIKPLIKRIRAAEQRAAAGVEYGGVYEPGKTYPRSTLVTRHGGLWLTLKETAAVPGTSGEAWKLVVKSGGAA